MTDKLLDEARTRAAAAAARLRAAEHGDPTRPGWDSEYESAANAVRATSRRVEGLERLRAAQVERGGKRETAVKEAAGDLKAIAAALSASRDQVAAAAAEHLRALAALATAAAAHNALLAEGRARIAAAGLRVRDDLLDEGQEHAEGVHDGPALRAAGTDWTPVPAGGIVAHALRLVFADAGPRHPLAAFGKYLWRSFEVEARPDGLKVPTLKNAGATLPPVPPRPVMPERPSARDLMAPPVLAREGGYYPDEPRRDRRSA